MLEKKHIDQLFLERLKDYEKDPPIFIWKNIENEISHRKKNLNFKDIFAVAAAVIVLVLSCWWLIAEYSKVDSQEITSREFYSSGQQKNNFRITIPGKFCPSAFFNKLALKKIHEESSDEESLPVEINENKLLTRINPDSMNKMSGVISLAVSDQNGSALKIQPLKERNTKEITDESYKDLKKWSIGIQAGPVITRGIKKTEGLNTQTENPLSAGFMAGYKISKRFSIQSGLLLNQVKRSSGLVTNPGNTSSEIITPSGIVNFNRAIKGDVLEQKFSYLSIPLHANYKIIDKKISLGVNAGINADILVENRAVFSDNKLNISMENGDMRHLAWSGDFGLDLGYEIGKRITLTIGPHLKHYFHSLSSNSTINFQPYQAGLIAGVSYSFN